MDYSLITSVIDIRRNTTISTEMSVIKIVAVHNDIFFYINSSYAMNIVHQHAQ